MRERHKNARQAAEAQNMKRQHMQVGLGGRRGGDVGGWHCALVVGELGISCVSRWPKGQHMQVGALAILVS